ncbi:conserved hypothetical protein [Methylobacterium sp. 4-46]|uniref:YsnF/AvaK domain-containing protein n=1 Tax=unclassified Methylobacterium TaxID=2615210 RepID=UPI000152D40E|nr:conserved hypothetical protein [Methylobacterium sp. 4-46]
MKPSSDPISIAEGNDQASSDRHAERHSETSVRSTAAVELSESSQTIPIAEETARIDKRVVETGRVRVRTHVALSEQVLRETLRSDAVGVSRVPIDRVIAEGEPAPQVRTEAGVTIIPVLEEVLVVEKRLILKEEVHIRQTTRGEDVELPVTLRRQHATIERLRPDGTPNPDSPTEE